MADQERILMRNGNNVADMTGVFETLVEAVSFFQGAAKYKHPQANFRGCCIEQNAGMPWMRRFSFVDRHSRIVSIELDLRMMIHNPQLYFEHLMEHLDKTMTAANNEGRIMVPVTTNLSKAVAAANEAQVSRAPVLPFNTNVEPIH